MPQYPAYVEYAFTSIEVIGIDEEYINVFAERWGGLGLDAFARALREGVLRDKQVAAFALGATRSRWARDLLLPFISNEAPEIRWAVALMLGEMREEAAFPALVGMLQEFLPSSPLMDSWFAFKQPYVAHLLGSWGKEEAISALRDTLAKLWQIEQEVGEQEDFQTWWHYQDALVYALGQLGVFDALTGLNIALPRIRLWQVTVVMGYLNAMQTYRQTIVDILQDTSRNEGRIAFLALVPELLQQTMGWSESDAATFSEDYQRDYFGRWGENQWGRTHD